MSSLSSINVQGSYLKLVPDHMTESSAAAAAAAAGAAATIGTTTAPPSTPTNTTTETVLEAVQKFITVANQQNALHHLLEGLKAYMARQNIPFTPEGLSSCLDSMQDLERLLDLLIDPVTLTPMEKPVLLPNGQTMERTSVPADVIKSANDSVLSCPGFVVDDVTSALLEVIKAFWAKHPGCAPLKELPYTASAKVPCLEGPPRWFHLLSAVMQPKTFFVRKLGECFVLEARLPVSIQSEFSVIRTPFTVDEDGYLVSFPASKGTGIKFKNVDELLGHLGCSGFSPLSEKDLNLMESSVGKDKLIGCTYVPIAGEFWLKVIENLQLRLTEDQASEIALQHPNQIVIRPVVTPSITPAFTMVHAPDGTLNSLRKLRYMWHGGFLYATRSCSYRLSGGVYHIETPSGWKAVSELNASLPGEDWLKLSWQLLSPTDQVGRIFIPEGLPVDLQKTLEFHQWTLYLSPKKKSSYVKLTPKDD